MHVLYYVLCSSLSVPNMPKRKQLCRVKSAGDAGGGETPTWQSQMMTSLKSKFRRNRTSSVDSGSCLPDIAARAKCSTLPARVTSLDRREEKGKPSTPYWMLNMVEELEGSLNGDAAIHDSDESVDSGFHPKHDITTLHCGSSLVARCPQRLDRASSPYYDREAVDKAFGPMKDIGRWYNSYNSNQTQEEDRYIHRPMVPIPVPIPEEEQHIAARPLPPIPARSRRLDEEKVYEYVQQRMLGSNGLTLDLRNLAQFGWYWGPITRVEAEEQLSGVKDGTFLVRDSSDDRYLLSLSFHSQSKILHTRIEYCNGNFSFYSFPDAENEGYPSVVELIQRSMQYSRDGVFCFSRARASGSPAVPVRLLKPLSRFNRVQSLQHYCRFVIRQSIRFDKIRQLPLPCHMQGYLEQSQF